MPSIASPSGDGGRSGSSERSGRRPGATSTRVDILRAARKLFSENGYQGTTMRAIAHEAKVDAALIHHFYLSKEGVFAAAVEDAFRPQELISQLLASPDPDTMGAHMVSVVLKVWQSPATQAPVIAVLRSAMSHPDASRLLGELISGRVLMKVVTALGCDQEELRAAVIGSQLIGLAILRFVLRLEPLATAEDSTIVGILGPTIQRYLYAAIDVPEA